MQLTHKHEAGLKLVKKKRPRRARFEDIRFEDVAPLPCENHPKRHEIFGPPLFLEMRGWHYYRSPSGEWVPHRNMRMINDPLYTVPYAYMHLGVDGEGLRE